MREILKEDESLLAQVADPFAGGLTQGGTMKTAVLISHDTVLITITERILQGYCRIIPFNSVGSALESYSIVPNLLIIDMPLDDVNTIETLNGLKGDPCLPICPVLSVSEQPFEVAMG